MSIQEIKDKYGVIQPLPGYAVIKEIEEVKTGIVKSNRGESRAYGTIIAINDLKINDQDVLRIPPGFLNIGDIVCYNEYEGQELFKHGPIIEDHIIVLKLEDIFLKLDWQPTQEELGAPIEQN